MSFSEYYMQDFDTYKSVFRQHSQRIAEMMCILDGCIQKENGMIVGRPKDLFRMVMDMTYSVDKTYKKEKGIKENEDDYLLHYSFKDDAKEEMRSLLREEIERYFNTKTES